MMRFFTLVAVLAAHASLACAGNVLPAGGALAAGEKLTSPDGHLTLVMQADGNLVLYCGTTAVWNSGTNGIGAAECHMQADGNLVVYAIGDGMKTARWASITGQAGATLSLQDDGNAVVYHDRIPQWSSNSATQVAPITRLHLGMIEFGHTPAECAELAEQWAKLLTPKDKQPAPTDTKPKLPEHTKMPQPRPTPKVPASLSKLPEGKKSEAAARFKQLLKYGKWAVRVGGKAFTVVGWVHTLGESAILVCDGGEWVYYQLEGEGGEPNEYAGRIKVLADEAGEQEAISPSREADGTCTLTFHSGYLSATADKVVANGIRVGESEKFRITRHDDGTVSLQSVATGKYLATTEADGTLTANAEATDPTTKFTPEVYENTLFLKRSDGKYVSAEPHRRITHRVQENVEDGADYSKRKIELGADWVGEIAHKVTRWAWDVAKGGWKISRRQFVEE